MGKKLKTDLEFFPALRALVRENPATARTEQRIRQLVHPGRAQSIAQNDLDTGFMRAMEEGELRR